MESLGYLLAALLFGGVVLAVAAVVLAGVLTVRWRRRAIDRMASADAGSTPPRA